MNDNACDFLPEALRSYSLSCGKNLYELRIRANKPVRANVNGEFNTVSYKGTPIIYTAEEIEEIVCRACDGSLYAYNDFIKKGYVAKNGVRIGLCGRCVIENGVIKTIADFNALCIRIPHEVRDCSLPIFNKIKSHSDLSTLLISPPGQGKTTVLRDLARVLSELGKNVLVVDEKGEIAPCGLALGDNTDVLSGCDKRFGLFTAIKNLCPEVVIVDELTTAEDISGIVFAKRSGVSVIASVHGPSIKDVYDKEYMRGSLNGDIFKYFAVIRLFGGRISIIEEKVSDSDD